MRVREESYSNDYSDLNPVFLVGDRFKEQCADSRLISISELFDLVARLRTSIGSSEKLFVLPGQGVNDEQIAQISKGIRHRAVAGKIVLHPHLQDPTASRAATHKHKSTNIVLTEPKIVEDGKYYATLRVDDQCDDIRDHLTGMHLPGMLITEAARQMVLVVSEKFIASPQACGQLSYVTHKQSVDFNNFLFPINVDIYASIENVRRSGPINFQANMKITFVQGGSTRVQSEFSFSALDRRIVAAQETRLADSTIGFGLQMSREIGATEAPEALEAIAS